MSSRPAYVIGVATTRFVTPGYEPWDYPEMAALAARQALMDAEVDYRAVQEAFVGYCYGDSIYGQRVLQELGLTGIPITNLHNLCATGVTVLRHARRAVLAGEADCVLAVGFDRMPRGRVDGHWRDRASPLQRHFAALRAGTRERTGPPGVELGAAAAADHMARYGSRPEQFAAVAVKNYAHAQRNPYAQFRRAYTLAEITASRIVVAPLTLLECSRAGVGAAAVVVASPGLAARRGLSRAVEIWAQALVSDTEQTFPPDGNGIDVLGYHSASAAARRVYEEAGAGPADIQVVELHDAFSCAEIIAYEALDLVPRGQGQDLVERGDTTYGGRWVVNPSGGLIARGNPSGATGLAQCVELVWQLRGEAGPRQVPRARVALQHNVSPGAAGVTLYRRPTATSSATLSEPPARGLAP